MASSGSAGPSGGPDSSTGPSGKTRRQRKRPRSHSSAAVEDQGTKLQEEDFTW